MLKLFLLRFDTIAVYVYAFDVKDMCDIVIHENPYYFLHEGKLYYSMTGKKDVNNRYTSLVNIKVIEQKRGIVHSHVMG